MTHTPPNIGRYALLDPIATGGMATVHLGRLIGPMGFARTVAIKRLHAHLCRTPDFVAMFLDEASLAARVQHPNVVSTLDVIEADGELFLVMDYVHGVSLSYLLREAKLCDTRLPAPVAVNIITGALRGLHAAHIAVNERGERLALVHRDVSPPNILVGVDGVARVVDFGIAKASERRQITREGELKGKLSYMSPEQLEGSEATPQSDIFSASICLWEALTGERLFQGDNDADLVQNILRGTIDPPSRHVPELPAALDDVVMRGLSRSHAERYDSAAAMAVDLERVVGVLPPDTIGVSVRAFASKVLAAREGLLSTIESGAEAPVSMRTVMDRLSRNSLSSISAMSAINIEPPGPPTPVTKPFALTRPAMIEPEPPLSIFRARRVPIAIGAATCLLVLGLLAAAHFSGVSEPGPSSLLPEPAGSSR